MVGDPNIMRLKWSEFRGFIWLEWSETREEVWTHSMEKIGKKKNCVLVVMLVKKLVTYSEIYVTVFLGNYTFYSFNFT